MKKNTLLFGLCMLVAPSFAGLDSHTSIVEVRDGSDQAGFVSFTVDANSFPNASPTRPVYLRLALNQGVTLCQTLVDVEGGPVGHDPIFLPLRLSGAPASVQMAAPEDTVSIVRWIAGESEIWLAVNQSSQSWLFSLDLGPIAPSPTVPVLFSLGTTARVSDQIHVGPGEAGNQNANLAYATRESNAMAVSTLLCVNALDSRLENAPEVSYYSQLKFYPSAWDRPTGVTSSVDLGGVDRGYPAFVGFSNDATIARRYPQEQCQPASSSALRLASLASFGGITRDVNQVLLTPGCPQGLHRNSTLTAAIPNSLNRGFEVLLDKSGDPVPSGDGVALVGGVLALGSQWSQPLGDVDQLFQVGGVWVTRAATVTYEGSGDELPADLTIDLTTVRADEDQFSGRFSFTVNGTTVDSVLDAAPYEHPDQAAYCDQSTASGSGDVFLFGGNAVISEVLFNGGDGNDLAELHNRGDGALDLSGWWLVSQEAAGQLGADRVLAAGQAVTVHLNETGLDTATDWYLSSPIELETVDELALYVDQQFDSRNSIRSYVQWGAPNQSHAGIAADAVLWVHPNQAVETVDVNHAIALRPGKGYLWGACDWLDQPQPDLGEANTLDGDAAYAQLLTTWPDSTILDMVTVLCRTTLSQGNGLQSGSRVATRKGGL